MGSLQIATTRAGHFWSIEIVWGETGTGGLVLQEKTRARGAATIAYYFCNIKTI